MNLKPISFDVEGLTLRGSVYEPKGGFEQEKRYPTALLFHGFGGNRIDFSGFMVQMARSLSQQGIVAITYDRAGHGESDGTFFDVSISREVRHAKQVLQQVCSLDYVDENNLHFGGISLGAVVESIVASETAAKPRSMVMVSSAASCVDEITSGKIQGKSLEGLRTQSYFDFMGAKMGPAMVEDVKGLDLYAKVTGCTSDVLLIHGTADFVPVEYAQRYKDVFGYRATLIVKENGDHGFCSVPDREFVMSKTAQFIAEHAGVSYQGVEIF